MSFWHFSLPCLLLVSLAACPAAIAETPQPSVPTQPSAQAATPLKKTKPAKAPGHADKTKTEKADAIKPRALEDNMQDSMFSDPGMPVMSAPSSPHPEAAAAQKAAPAGAGAASLSMKWHATSDVDPYDIVRHTSGPDGQGESVLGGIKFGF